MSDKNDVLEVELSEPQNYVVHSNTNRVLNIAGQGGGKSACLGFVTYNFIMNFPKAKGFIAANTSRQLDDSVLTAVFKIWSEKFGIKEYNAKTCPDGCFTYKVIPPAHFKRIHEVPSYSSIISFDNGTLIYVGSLENYLAHDGKEFCWAHLDETKDTKEKAVKSVILGRLRQRGLWVDLKTGVPFWDESITDEQAEERRLRAWNPLYVHTSPSDGQIDWLLDMFKLKDKEKEIRLTLMDDNKFYKYEDDYRTVVIYQSWWNFYLTKQYIKERLETYSEIEVMKFLRGYPFSKSGGEAYKEFNREANVAKIEDFECNNTRHLSFDFNVLPYITMLESKVQTKVKFYDVKKKRHFDKPAPGREPIMTTTFYFTREFPMKPPKNATELAALHYKTILDNEYNSPVEVALNVYGDSTGKNRIIGLPTQNQFSIIEEALEDYLFGDWLCVPKVNYHTKSRLSFINAVFGGRKKGLEIIIDPSCETLIKDIDYVKEAADGTKLKEKAKDENGISYEKIGHFSDALDYMVTYYCKTFLNLTIK